jgi:hypothetical protein
MRQEKVLADVRDAVAKIDTQKSTEQLAAARTLQKTIEAEHTTALNALTQHLAAMSYIIHQARAGDKNQKCIVRYAKSKVHTPQPHMVFTCLVCSRAFDVFCVSVLFGPRHVLHRQELHSCVCVCVCVCVFSLFCLCIVHGYSMGNDLLWGQCWLVRFKWT